MRKQLVTLVTLLGLFVSGAALAEQRVLRGHVLLVEKNDETRPASGAQVELPGYGNPARTDSSGMFRLFLPDAFKAGDPVTLSVRLKGYRVWSPQEGRTLVPKSLETQVLEVRLLPAGSRKFLSDEGIEQLLRAAMDSTRNQPPESANPRGGTELSRYLADWAHQYGFSAQQVKAEVERWIAEVEKKQDDESRMAVAAFARKDFQAAARHAGASAERKRQRLEELLQKTEAEKQRLGDEVARDYQLQGAAYIQDRKHFGEALQAYEQAVKYVSKQSDPLLWASLWSNLGLSHQLLGMEKRTGTGALEHLEAAVVAYRRAMEVPIREQQPMLWVVTYSNLSHTLLRLGRSSAEERQAEWLKQAVEASRLALQVDVRKTYPTLAENLQTALGTALLELGRRTQGEAGLSLLAQSVEALELALATPTCNCGEKKDPKRQAELHHLLGGTLLDKSMRAHSDEEALREAVRAEKEFRSALSGVTREQAPESWAANQNNLGLALLHQGEHTQGEARFSLLSRAADASCLALSSMSRGTKEWREARQNLHRTVLEYAKAISDYASVLPEDFVLQTRSLESLKLAAYLQGSRLVWPALPRSSPMTPQLEAGLRAMDITLALAFRDSEAVPGELDALRAVIAAQPPDFKISWDFSLLRCFILSEGRLDSSSDWLRTLLQALQADHRDAIFEGLYNARRSFGTH
ncbi:hypothetical protein [Archangium gephyra]|uniref:Argininosuccinate lyase n=1 Tax=Archangium gephyra TaxID=48 RepID=A0AAC8Q0I7_9BACT|nr:hypothetical protein [Archangium gephyra]AKI98747.1 Argininosuccinate lyase [Archangium gephyra]